MKSISILYMIAVMALSPIVGWTIPVEIPSELCCNIPPEEFYALQYKGTEATKFPCLIIALCLLVFVAAALQPYFFSRTVANYNNKS